MNKMPHEIKQKIRQYNRAVQKASKLAREVDTMFENHNVPIENLIALDNIYSNNMQTEALAYIHNGECTTEMALENAIKQIEDVFLYFVNDVCE